MIEKEQDPSEDSEMSPANSEEEDKMVVSGGGVASTEEEESATAEGERGLG